MSAADISAYLCSKNATVCAWAIAFLFECKNLQAVPGDTQLQVPVPLTLRLLMSYIYIYIYIYIWSAYS